MTLEDIDTDLKLCRKHLNSTKKRGTEIEFFLTQFLLVRICGQYEGEIVRIVNQRAKKSGDQDLASFIEKTIEGYKHLKLDAIRGNILRRFGTKYAEKFDKKIKNKESEIRYQNIIANRDSSAHGGRVQMTFDELIISHKKAKRVLHVLDNILNK